MEILALLVGRSAVAEQLIGARGDDRSSRPPSDAPSPPRRADGSPRPARHGRPPRAARTRARPLNVRTYPDPMARVTLQTIADHVGVSRMTVSNAFSRPDQLSDTLRRTIWTPPGSWAMSAPIPPRVPSRAARPGPSASCSQRPCGTPSPTTSRWVPRRHHRRPRPDRSGADPDLHHAAADIVPARDAALDGAIVYACDPDTTAADWLLSAGCRW